MKTSPALTVVSKTAAMAVTRIAIEIERTLRPREARTTARTISPTTTSHNSPTKPQYIGEIHDYLIRFSVEMIWVIDYTRLPDRPAGCVAPTSNS
jgi:hypothetical protein